MTSNNPVLGTNPALPTVQECQNTAVLLAGLIEGINLMQNDGSNYDNARFATTVIAARLANQLADNLDKVTA